MTKEEQLGFCKKCLNRRLDFNIGLVCNLTGRVADFENECKDYNYDKSIVEKLDDEEPVQHEDVIHNLSEENLTRFRAEQNYPAALIVGIVVGLLGAVLWGVITVATGYQIGYMAIAIGAGVGLSMRFAGKGIDPIFGITGGLIAILSCLLGNFFSIVGYLGSIEGMGVFEVLGVFDYGQLIPIMTETFSFMDIVFYGIAAYEGFKFAFRTFTEKDIHELR
ncbi:hypothetical protein [Spongiivirga citrea]|uniref:Uncharacterized protein n=1 Tax=Spongiivirga citrea TaxID=1481457 RepID=A0A6M0CH97_9FLAO|nr:hypothetical protein [Spongiivirga citrea]NER17306.1 hypothetical protein [Spongiivirga citrea]